MRLFDTDCSDMYDLEYKIDKLDMQHETLLRQIEAVEYERSEVYQKWERMERRRRYIAGAIHRDRGTLASLVSILDCDNKLIQMLIDPDYDVRDDNIYRIKIEGKKAEVVCLGLDSVDAKCTGEYYVQRLPKWIQKRLAILLMLDPKKPEAVEGVGVRLERDIFWVFKDGAKAPHPDTSSHGE